MKTPLTIVTALFLCSLSAFAEQHSINIKCIVGNGKNAITLQATKSPEKLSDSRQVNFPTKWDLPILKNIPQGSILVPLTPSAFESTNSGWTVQWSAERVGDLIRLTGSATFIEPEMTKAVYGEHSYPIYLPHDNKILLSESKAETVSTLSSDCHFQLFAKPGKEYEIKLRQLDKWVPCFITCELAIK